MSELKIKVGKKEYDLPDLDVDHWKTLIDKEEKLKDDLTVFTSDGIKEGIEFFYNLLNPYYPELTRKVLGKMPLYQMGGLFKMKITQELLTPPLDLEPNELEVENLKENL